MVLVAHGHPRFSLRRHVEPVPNARALSVSMPIPAAGGDVMGAVVENYFDNLLPDSTRIRDRLRRRFGAPSTKAADLLAAIGRDCVGAVQLLPDGVTPEAHDHINSQPLTDGQIEALLKDLTTDANEADSLLADFRISIAGAQEKTALLRIRDQWHLPHAATPTTHILKLPLGLVGNMRADMTDSVENEWLLPAHFPRPVFNAIRQGMLAHVEKFVAGMS